MRGLERTCSSPCVSRKLSKAAKLLVWKASPKMVPGTAAPAARKGARPPGLDENSERGFGSPSAPSVVKLDIVPCGLNEVPGWTRPPAARVLLPAWNAAQL